MRGSSGGALPLALLLMLGGCSSEPTAEADPPQMTSTPERLSHPADDDGETEEDLPKVEVYRFAETMVGTGGSRYDSEPTRVETFMAPAGTVGLEVGAWHGDGAASLRVEILGPDGEVAFNGRHWTSVSAQGHTVSSISMDERTEDGLGPGEYTVRYYVGGAIEVFVSALAVGPGQE